MIALINNDLRKIFEELGDIEEVEGNRWESLAYRKAAASISSLGEDVARIAERGELRKIDGVGPAIERKILQYIREGRIDKYDQMKKIYPVDFSTLRKIQGLGPKKIAQLFLRLGVKNLEDLQKAITENRIAGLEGFGQKSQENIARGVRLLVESGPERIPLGLVYDQVMAFRGRLLATGSFQRLEPAGSFRRMRDTLGDLDFLATAADRHAATDAILAMDDVKEVISRGESRVTVLLDIGLTCDFRFIGEESFGSAMQYFTGSKEHNIRMRDIAISMGLKLSEYGLFRNDERLEGSSEQKIYQKLVGQWIEPELRENNGEIEAAVSGNLPKLVSNDQIKGDLHAHTVDSDGKDSLEEMVNAAVGAGLSYIAITNHSRSLRVARGLDEGRFRMMNSQIDNMQNEGIWVMKGVELEILRDGSLDLSGAVLDQMDYVVAALHQSIGTEQENTSRVIKAIESGYVDAFAHPTGRLIGTRAPYDLNLDLIFEACRDNKVLLEINGQPERSDLPSDLVRRAAASGNMFVLGSDAHSVRDLRNLRFACAVARRGWLTPELVVNTMTADELRKLIKSRRK